MAHPNKLTAQSDPSVLAPFNLILSKSQAQAVYRAMCELNNVGGILNARFFGDLKEFIHVKEYLTDQVQVYRGNQVGDPLGGPTENYTNQAAFAQAYELS